MKRMRISCLTSVLLSALVAAVLLLVAGPQLANTQELRPPSQWTEQKPATRAEIEAQLAKHRGEELTFVSYGGAAQAAERKAFLEPLEKNFGLRFTEESNANSAKIQAMVDSGKVTWDVVGIGTYEMWSLGQKGHLEKLDQRVVDTRKVLPAARTPWGGGGGLDVWGTVLAYRDGVREPSSWADFWDVKNFPGRRGYGDYMSGHLEVPLLATGMKPADIKTPTKTQEEIIFRKLTELAPNITVYWNSGQQPPELLIRGELDYTSAWNGRIYDAQRSGAPQLKICWKCGWMAASNAWAIPRGSPRKELAQLVIAWSTFPEVLTEATRYISYGPALANSEIPRVMEILSKTLDKSALEQVTGLTYNRPYMVPVNEKWEGDNFDRLNTRYQAIFQKKQ